MCVIQLSMIFGEKIGVMKTIRQKEIVQTILIICSSYQSCAPLNDIFLCFESKI